LEKSAWDRLAAMELATAKIRGLGPKRLAALEKVGVVSVLDLLAHLPRQYRDFSQVSEISKLHADEYAHVQGRVLSIRSGKTRHKRVQILEGLLDDGSGSLRVIWYGRNFLAKQIRKGTNWALMGKVKREKTGLTLVNPKAYALDNADPDSDHLEVVYPQLGGLRSEDVARWIGELLDRSLPEPELPEVLANHLRMPSFFTALRQIHRPGSLTGNGEPAEFGIALKRLKVQEFFQFQAELQKMVHFSQSRAHPRLKVTRDDADDFAAKLPFRPTGDQHRVMAGILETLTHGGRLHALVQGDVGSGKTLIALFAGYCFHKYGYQSALMAPTTLLAEQHYQNAKSLLAPFGVRVALLSGDRSPAENMDLIRSIGEGGADFIVGTHSLFQDRVRFANLGLVLIDEQHRFGVEQRASLLKKAAAPHYLAFSATPIPRSLALTLHGNFQVYQIREKPVGRQPIHTVLKRSANREEVIAFAKKRLALGEAVFWVFPLIEDDQQRTENSAIAMHRHLAKYHFGENQVGLVHGRMEKSEIASTMNAFREGRIPVLVATTVIEVGVDVPHASIMVIEGAQHFGLSQLHQLRGRVGRGAKRAFCFLMIPKETSGESLQRMKLLESSDDGFQIAEADLEGRGAGQLLGKAQSGSARFRFGDPWEDRDLMDLVRQAIKGGEKGVQ